MNRQLIECCELILKLLTQLRDEGKITQKEYEKHVEPKIKFLGVAP